MRRLALALTALLLASGCGGDDDEAQPTRTETVEPDSRVDVVAHEYRFDPSTVRMSGPGRLTIRLRNEGDLAHNLRVFRDDREIGGTPTFQGGRTESGRVELQPGTYEMVCTVGDHAELGMTGTLEVK
jgi:plastocyanin